ncbi:MAG: hypothetical protein Q8P58_02160 [Candidatus Adlerbacteria bacterium]|nr:hypothetical protein [Candidatus Adlerbacteria bacterium]MDZ4226000.1 hypothetical protein [Patescibacteria group bacterium]
MKKILSQGASVVGILSLLAFASPALAAAPVWNTTGSWVVAFDYLGTLYPHDMTLTQNGAGGLTGGGGYLAGATHT